jgi:FKBP-type peptidyl-prolyl cis-trans isomerase FkpA
VTLHAPLYRALTLAVAATLLAAAGACTKTPTGPSSSAPYSQLDLKLGTGTEAAKGNVVTLNYTGWLYDPTKTDGKGLMFDTSVGATPLTFTLGSNQVIPGFEQGVVGMKVGGARRITVPPSLGYGSVRNNSIPPYATLIFDVDLLDVTASGG